MVEKEGSPAVGGRAASGSIATQGRAGSRGIVERARSLESETWTDPDPTAPGSVI